MVAIHRKDQAPKTFTSFASSWSLAPKVSIWTSLPLDREVAGSNPAGT
jgi:hypothetical protein